VTGTALIVVGTLVATVCAYLFQLLGGRTLGPEAFAPLTILWTVQFVAMHVLYQPLEQYAIRQVELRRGIDWRFVAGGIAVTTVLAAVFVELTLELLFSGDRTYVWIAALMTLAYAGFALVRSQLAGAHRYEAYGLATGAEGLLRLVAAGAILGVTTSAVGLSWAMVLAPFAVLPWLGRFPRAGAREPAAGLLLPMIGASVSAQLLIGAAPIAVAFLGATPATVSIVFVTFALLRGPLWIIQGLFARVLPPLTALARDGETAQLRWWSRRITAAAAAAAAASGIAAAAVGPAVIAWLFGPDFRPPTAMTGLVGAGVVLAAGGLLSNQILIAFGRTTRMTTAWTAALAVAAIALLLPGTPDVRVSAAFLIGQIVAVSLLTHAIGQVCQAAPSTPVTVPGSGGAPPTAPVLTAAPRLDEEGSTS
jgi:O-antigen/teichoic acid export membrane protein